MMAGSDIRGIIHSTECNLSSIRLLTVAMKICLYVVCTVTGVSYAVLTFS